MSDKQILMKIARLQKEYFEESVNPKTLSITKVKEKNQNYSEIFARLSEENRELEEVR